MNLIHIIESYFIKSEESVSSVELMELFSNKYLDKQNTIEVSRRHMPTFETNLLSFSFVNRMENKSVRAVHHLRAFLQKPVCECLVFGNREGERENSQYVKLLATF